MLKFSQFLRSCVSEDARYAYNSNINHHLIHGAPKSKEDDEIHRSIMNHPGDRVKGTFHSGISSDFAKKIADHDTVHSQAHVSTSSDESTAKEYAERRAGFRSSGDAHVAHFHLPDGYKKGLHVHGFGKEEKEYLLKAGQKFKHRDPSNKVRSETDKYGRKWHHYDLVPSDD